MNDSLSAGAAVIDITPGVGLPMGGYGARVGVATGIHDPLHVRTLVLDDGANQLVLAICDLVGVPVELVEQARAQIEADCGIPAGNVCISATHTHSGPLLRREGIAEYISVTARKIAGSVQVARQALRTVTLKLATAEVSSISQNRRDPDGPIQTAAHILLAAPPGGAEPVATLVNYACHATVLEYDNLLYSADFPGQMAAAVERELGGVALYMQGAAGNINPIWMRHDFAEIRRIGGILGGAAGRAAHELRPLGEGQWAVNLNWSEETPKEPAPGVVLSGIGLKAAQRFVELERRALPSLDEIESEIAQLETKLAALAGDDQAGRRAIRPRLNTLRMDRVQRLTDSAEPGQREPVELQAFRLSDECAVVTLPGEFFVEIGSEIEREAGVEHLLICGYANATAGYVPTAAAFPQGGYECGRARFAPEAAATIVREAAALVRSLYA